jgi:hypothetical protein
LLELFFLISKAFKNLCLFTLSVRHVAAMRPYARHKSPRWQRYAAAAYTVHWVVIGIRQLRFGLLGLVTPWFPMSVLTLSFFILSLFILSFFILNFFTFNAFILSLDLKCDL